MGIHKEINLKFNINFTLPILIFLLTACGGGADSIAIVEDDTPDAPPTPVKSQFMISSDNLEKTALISLSSIFYNVALNTADIFTDDVVEQSAVQLYNSKQRLISKHLKRSLSSGNSFAESANASTTHCEISGSTTTTFEFENPYVISVNDSVTFESIDCNDGQNITNGTFVFQFTQLIDFIDLEHYGTLGLNIIYDGYSLKSLKNSNNITISSMYSLLITKDTYSTEIEIKSPLLAMVVNEYVQLLQNLEVTREYIKNTNIETMSVSNSLMDNALMGKVIITTLEDFEFYGPASDVPNSGSIKITAEDNSVIILTVLNNTDVQLDADFNADDVIDETRVVTWESLVSQ